MKKLAFSALLICLGITLSAAKDPVRVSVDINNSGEVDLWYQDLGYQFPASLSFSWQAPGSERSESCFCLPDDGRIFNCYLSFENNWHLPHSIKLILMPGETIGIEGAILDSHTELSITGSQMMSAWAEHRKTYIPYQRILSSECLYGHHPETEDNYREKTFCYNELSGKVDTEIYSFMKANPEHPLSAYYYCEHPGEDHYYTYDMLAGHLKDSNYKELLDYMRWYWDIVKSDGYGS